MGSELGLTNVECGKSKWNVEEMFGKPIAAADVINWSTYIVHRIPQVVLHTVTNTV